MIVLSLPTHEPNVTTITAGNWYKVLHKGIVTQYVYCAEGYFTVFVGKAKGPHVRILSDFPSWYTNTIVNDDYSLVYCEPIVSFSEKK